jgi:hypothetical protein
MHKERSQVKKDQRKMRLTMCERVIVIIIHFVLKALNLLIIVLIMSTYNIGYIMISCAGMMVGNLVFGLIQDSIVIKRVKRERKELEKKRIQMTELLGHKHQKSKKNNTMESEGEDGTGSAKIIDLGLKRGKMADI